MRATLIGAGIGRLAAAHGLLPIGVGRRDFMKRPRRSLSRCGTLDDTRTAYQLAVGGSILLSILVSCRRLTSH
jgi:hypothetical protein